MPKCFSPYDYWQFWRNTEDADVGRFLRLFTTSAAGRRSRGWKALQGAEINEAKKALANEATRAPAWRRGGGRSRRDGAPRPSRKARLAATLPTVEIKLAELEAGIPYAAAFVLAGLASSNGDARRQIKGGGLRVNDKAVTDEHGKLGAGRCHGREGDQAFARPQAPCPAEAGVPADARRFGRGGTPWQAAR